MNTLNILLLISSIICIISVFLSIKAKSTDEYFLYQSSSVNNSDDNSNDNNSDDINPFTTNKFLYSAGYINDKDCSTRCSKRFKDCKQYFPIGNSYWCNSLYDECSAQCKWNKVFN